MALAVHVLHGLAHDPRQLDQRQEKRLVGWIGDTDLASGQRGWSAQSETDPPGEKQKKEKESVIRFHNVEHILTIHRSTNSKT